MVFSYLETIYIHTLAFYPIIKEKSYNTHPVSLRVPTN